MFECSLRHNNKQLSFRRYSSLIKYMIYYSDGASVFAFNIQDEPFNWDSFFDVLEFSKFSSANLTIISPEMGEGFAKFLVKTNKQYFKINFALSSEETVIKILDAVKPNQVIDIDFQKVKITPKLDLHLQKYFFKRQQFCRISGYYNDILFANHYILAKYKFHKYSHYKDSGFRFGNKLNSEISKATYLAVSIYSNELLTDNQIKQLQLYKNLIIAILVGDIDLKIKLPVVNFITAVKLINSAEEYFEFNKSNTWRDEKEVPVYNVKSFVNEVS